MFDAMHSYEQACKTQHPRDTRDSLAACGDTWGVPFVHSNPLPVSFALGKISQKRSASIWQVYVDTERVNEFCMR